MSEELKYMLKLSVSNGADVDEIEDFLQQVLMDLYEQGQVESIKLTKDGHTADGIEEITDAIGGVDSEAVRKAIDSVRELEKSDDG